MSQPEVPSVNFIDNPHAPDFFATSATGFYNHGGNAVSITLESLRVDHSTAPGPMNRVVIGRLVMPVQGAKTLALGLFDFLKGQGLDPVDLLKSAEESTQ